MENAKQELLDAVGTKGLLSAKLSYQENTYILFEDHTSEELKIFLESIDFCYDDGYGFQELYGNVWLKDGTWLERLEYDGSERWRHVKRPNMPKKEESKDNSELLEKLADLEHQQWALWTRYMLDQLEEAIGLTFSEFRVDNPNHPVTKKAYENIDRWRRQIETPYSELSEKEKDSDREWARKVLDIVEGV